MVRDEKSPGARLPDAPATGSHPAIALPAGVRLDHWLEQTTRSWQAVLDVFLDIAQELASLHAAGNAYQEVRPEHVVIGTDGRAHLAGAPEVVTNMRKVGPSGLRTGLL